MIISDKKPGITVEYSRNFIVEDPTLNHYNTIGYIKYCNTIIYAVEGTDKVNISEKIIEKLIQYLEKGVTFIC